jgi:predicted Zn-dependent peptidase
MMAGKVSDDVVKLVEKHFDDKNWAKPAPPDVTRAITPSSGFKHRVKMPHSVQSSIRIGKRLFNKTHPDFQKMQVLNVLLGGYFGSRLMSNIREEKGFTYGIHSGLASLIHDGYFFISTEVGSEVTDNALNEIYKEIDRLRSKPVPDEELDLVKNYLSGKILSGLDGPFRLADYYQGLIIYGLDIEYIHQLLNTIKTVTSQQLQELANKYLNTEGMFEVVVG